MWERRLQVGRKAVGEEKGCKWGGRLRVGGRLQWGGRLQVGRRAAGR